MLVPGTLLQDRYLVHELIDQGGMGAVYRATDTRLNNTVALKQRTIADEASSSAFEREARLLANLDHPVLPRVTDYFIENEGQFLVMEYIPGEDLGTLLNRIGGALSNIEKLEWLLRWTDELLDALDYLHTQPSPIVHRDIKPKNLKVNRRGNIVLLDFGLAKGGLTQITRKWIDEGDSQTTVPIPNTTLIGFSVPYAPLEQIQGFAPDPRNDLYSLATTLYHMITGTLPPDARSRPGAKLRPITELAPHVPTAVTDVVHKALALEMDARPPSARAMREALALARKGLKSPPPLPPASVGTALRVVNVGTPLRAIAFNPLGELVAAGGEDRTISLWRASDGEMVSLLEGHTGSVHSVAFSPDGLLLASGGEDRTVRLWRVQDGHLLHVLKTEPQLVEHVAFSPDGMILASGGWNNSILLWQMEHDPPQRLSAISTPAVQSLAWSPDSQHLLVGGFDGKIYIRRFEDGRPAATLEGHTNFVLSVAFSPDGKRLAAGGKGGVVSLWQGRGNRRVRDDLHGHTHSVRSVAFSPDGQYLASGSEDRTARLWRISDLRSIAVIKPHDDGITGVCFSPDGRILVTGSRDGRLRFWRATG